jgi:hypothetical protein
MSDMRLLFGILILSLFIAGCLWSPLSEDDEVTQTTDQINQTQQTSANDTLPQDTTPIPDTKPDIPEPEPVPDTVAKSQADCSTLAPDCGSCLAKEGCSWCKDTNACYYEGIVPTISSCNPNAWATNLNECKIVPAGESCSKITNCADCLSGTGCSWCIQGSLCSADSSQENCFGGWLENSYQCNYASR